MKQYRLTKETTFDLRNGLSNDVYTLERKILMKKLFGESKKIWVPVEYADFEDLEYSAQYMKPARGDIAWAERVAKEYKIKVPTKARP